MDQPIEVLLKDGGHVIVTFADRACRLAAADPIVALLVSTEGSEGELAEAIRAEVTGLGLTTFASPDRHPTVVRVASG